MKQSQIVVIGGGLSGLISATVAARAGVPVVLVEKASAIGGRAATRERNGFCFNLGPHALYRHGILRKTLKALGVDANGGVPTGDGGFALVAGRLHTLPVGIVSLLTTGLMGVPAKVEFARLQKSLPAIDPRTVEQQPLASWLDAHAYHRPVRQLMEMLVRVTTFTNDPGSQSAGAAIEQLQLALSGSVLYVNGGWQTIVEGLRKTAVDAGVRIVCGRHAIALERRTAGEIDGVRMSDGSVIPASAAIATGSPSDVESVLDVKVLPAGAPSPVRVATLDLALASLPHPKRTVAFGLDVPLYFSVHSAVARLAPDGGAMIHVAKYLPPGEIAGRDVEEQLEALMDMMQPGWRERVELKQFLPNLAVTHWKLTARHAGTRGRPSTRVDAFENVFIAGDWVGGRGQLSDACAASAADAATAAAAVCTRQTQRAAVPA